MHKIKISIITHPTSNGFNIKMSLTDREKRDRVLCQGTGADIDRL